MRRLLLALRARLEPLELLTGFALVVIGVALWSPVVAAVIGGLGLIADALLPRKRRGS